MNIELSAIEARIIGCLIEKELTTPDYYPLTLNSLMTACNQKSNRNPVISINEGELLDAVNGLISRHLMSDESGFNSRVSKYQHRFCNTEFGDLKLSEQEVGIICCLLLRGPQTPGELRTRTNRLCSFSDVKETESVLEHLANLSSPLVVKLPREPGKRESRYQHLFCGKVDINTLTQASEQRASYEDMSRFEELEAEVLVLKAEVVELRAMIERLR